MSFKKPGDRAQSTSAEFLIGYFIFFLILTLTVLLWSEKVSDIQYSEHFYDREETAVDVAEKLVRTQGVPKNWTWQTVTVMGLADEPRVLSSRKVEDFILLMNDSTLAPQRYIASAAAGCAGLSNYECNKEVLGVGGYNFTLTIEDINGTIMRVNNKTCFAGITAVNQTDAVTVTRTAILDNQIARLKLTIWDKKEV